MDLRRIAVSALFAALVTGAAQAGERAVAEVTCEPVGEALSYHCMIMLKGRKTDEPIEASVTVKAAMPSMAMAHNMPPAKAMPIEGKPGMYMAKFKLEMYGVWALALDVNGKLVGSGERVRDRVIVKQEFGEAHAGSGHGQDHGHKKADE